MQGYQRQKYNTTYFTEAEYFNSGVYVFHSGKYAKMWKHEIQQLNLVVCYGMQMLIY